MSSRKSSSIARRAGGESSAGTEQRPRLGFRRANEGRLDHSCEPAATRLSLASAHGEARPVASARVGSGRSRFVGPRRRIRLEGPAQAKAAIRRHYSVQHSSPTSLWKLWKVRLWNRRRTLGFRAGGPATLRRSARREVTRTGGVREKPRKERELSQGLPNISHGLGDRVAPPVCDDLDEPHEVAFYYPECAEREFQAQLLMHLSQAPLGGKPCRRIDACSESSSLED